MILKSELSNVLTYQRNHLLSVPVYHIERSRFAQIEMGSSFIQIITGIRRSGKSTLLKSLLASQKHDFLYLNFEDPKLNDFELTDFSKLDAFNQGTLSAFDEIQNVLNWEKYIRSQHDAGKKIFITGSNASLLSRELGTRLTGRYISHLLFPFNYSEYLDFTKQKAGIKSLATYLKDGGFPEYLKEKNDEVLFYLFDDIIQRDITVRHGIRNHQILKELAIYLLSNIGKTYSLNRLRGLFGVGSARSISDYINFMEQSYLLFTIPKFSYSIRNQIGNAKKAYCIDTGLAGCNSLSLQTDTGRKLENAVFLHLRQHFRSIFYFADEKECDFVVMDKQEVVFLIQVCHELHTDNKDREIDGLKNAMKFFNHREGLIISSDQDDSFNTGIGEIQVVKAWKWLTLDLRLPPS